VLVERASRRARDERELIEMPAKEVETGQPATGSSPRFADA